MNILFVCTANLNRSPTFEKEVRKQDSYREHGGKLNVMSAGTLHGYPNILKEDLCKWADRIYVMDLTHERFIKQRFPEYLDKVVMVGISDQYDPDDPALKSLIRYWYKNHFLNKSDEEKEK